VSAAITAPCKPGGSASRNWRRVSRRLWEPSGWSYKVVVSPIDVVQRELDLARTPPRPPPWELGLAISPDLQSVAVVPIDPVKTPITEAWPGLGAI
jgi:hypothetical protein